MTKNERRLHQAGGVLRLYTFVFVKVEWRRVKEIAANESGTRCSGSGGYPLSAKLWSKHAVHSQTIDGRRYNFLLLAK